MMSPAEVPKPILTGDADRGFAMDLSSRNPVGEFARVGVVAERFGGRVVFVGIAAPGATGAAPGAPDAGAGPDRTRGQPARSSAGLGGADLTSAPDAEPERWVVVSIPAGQLREFVAELVNLLPEDISGAPPAGVAAGADGAFAEQRMVQIRVRLLLLKDRPRASPAEAQAKPAGPVESGPQRTRLDTGPSPEAGR
jgi:hypothetical protein